MQIHFEDMLLTMTQRKAEMIYARLLHSGYSKSQAIHALKSVFKVDVPYKGVVKP